MSNATSLHANPFSLLGVTPRDDRRKIVEMAEERALHLDHDRCQQARSDLTNPKSRIEAEMAWMPGIAPGVAQKLLNTLVSDPLSVTSAGKLPPLAQANLMSAAAELIGEDADTRTIARFICNFADVAENIELDVVLRDINEDRAISGFPEIRGEEAIKDAFAERRKAYRNVLKSLLDSIDSEKLVRTMTEVLEVATDDGDSQAPSLIDELTDAYEIETQYFLDQESENIAKLVEGVRLAASRGASAVTPLLDKLEKVARNWDRIAQPIQLSAKSRGLEHGPSTKVAYQLRSLGIDLNNNHGMLDQAHRMTVLLQELFAELPEVVERLNDDAEAITELREQARQQQASEEQWARDISFKADVGMMFKDELSIGPEGIQWKGTTYPLESITRVRWGAIRRSVNGIPSGTIYTIAFGDAHTVKTIELRKESTYSGFVNALWKAVCIRLMVDLLARLEAGEKAHFGDMTVEDSGVVLTKHKFLVPNESVRLGWHDVHVWSSNGLFVIGQQSDKKTYGSTSYIENWNSHILEHVIRSGFKKGVQKLSDFLKS